jgi:hypothetical protein
MDRMRYFSLSARGSLTGLLAVALLCLASTGCGRLLAKRFADDRYVEGRGGKTDTKPIKSAKDDPFPTAAEAGVQ